MCRCLWHEHLNALDLTHKTKHMHEFNRTTDLKASVQRLWGCLTIKKLRMRVAFLCEPIKSHTCVIFLIVKKPQNLCAEVFRLVVHARVTKNYSNTLTYFRLFVVMRGHPTWKPLYRGFKVGWQSRWLHMARITVSSFTYYCDSTGIHSTCVDNQPENLCTEVFRLVDSYVDCAWHV